MLLRLSALLFLTLSSAVTLQGQTKSSCDCNSFPITDEKCVVYCLKNAPIPQLQKSFNLDKKDAEKIKAIPNKQPLQTLKDFKNFIPEKAYSKIEQSIIVYINNSTAITQTSASGTNIGRDQNIYYTTPEKENSNNVTKQIILKFRWTDKDKGESFSCYATLTVTKNRYATGALQWTLVEVPSSNYNKKKYIGSQATEIVEGSFNPQRNELRFSGTAIQNDKFQLYAKETDYVIKLNANNQISGTSTGGYLNGTFEILD